MLDVGHQQLLVLLLVLQAQLYQCAQCRILPRRGQKVQHARIHIGPVRQHLGQRGARDQTALRPRVAGADMMNASLSLTQLPAQLADWVTHLGIAPLWIVVSVLVFYVILGCVMDEMSMLLLTIPVIFPAIMGLDLWGLAPEMKAIWFGILVLMTVGIGLIAPPVGLNVYVVNNLAGDTPMSETYKGVFPFLAWDVLRVVMLLLFPALTLGLVELFFQ